ncbi:putative DCAPL3 [Operophtera brumata]|uniref:Putative DCAPL3 n=1 Tax=Operophtera brumata TaxID=104452 RepID=A0A0L7L5S2_OPEBR|nr:putative DCAPL3 [Operophtera brumata]
MLKFCSPAAKRREPNAVNPGRKASLCGIREGDVISSINGRATRSMSNGDAHAMLRAAGPMLRLGLNEQKENHKEKDSLDNLGQSFSIYKVLCGLAYHKKRAINFDKN